MYSWIEINQRAFAHNVALIQQLLQGRAQLGVVLKANAYGHGLTTVGSLVKVMPHIPWLFAATLAEAVVLRQLGCVQEIMVLAVADDESLLDIFEYNIVVTVHDYRGLQRIVEAARKARKTARVHLKVDCGMHRLGFELDDLPCVYHDAIEFSELRIEGIFGHMGNTSNPHEGPLIAMVVKFYQACLALDPGRRLQHHVGASGMVWCSQVRDIVRVGTLVYGSWKSDIHAQRCMKQSVSPPVPIMSWKTCIVAIKHVPQGGYVGYDEVFCAHRPMIVAILPVGYADGYLRGLSQRGYVRVHDHYAPIVGVISMNVLAVDVSHIPLARAGSEVVLIGPYARITPNALARCAATNPNEITSSVRAYVPRRVVDSEITYEE